PARVTVPGQAIEPRLDVPGRPPRERLVDDRREPAVDVGAPLAEIGRQTRRDTPAEDGIPRILRRRPGEVDLLDPAAQLAKAPGRLLARHPHLRVHDAAEAEGRRPGRAQSLDPLPERLDVVDARGGRGERVP